MDRNDLAPLLQRHLFDHRRPRDSGIVDETVNGADPRLNIAHCCFRELWISHAPHIRQQPAVHGRGKGVELVAVEIDATTRAPRPIARLATACPIPCAAPVTTIVLPSSDITSGMDCSFLGAPAPLKPTS